MIEENDDSKIIWYEDSPGEGRMETKGGSQPIYTLPRAIERSIHSAINWLVQHPLLLAEAVALEETSTDEEFDKILAKFQFRNIRSFEPMNNIYGICKWNDYGKRLYYGRHIAEIIKKPVVQKLMDLIRAWKLKELEADMAAVTDFQFLAMLGYKRNWKSDCAICLSNEMGPPCGCGHYHPEVVILRPCGHSFCVQPCFKDLVRAFLQQELEPMRNDYKLNVDTQLKITCPLCRAVSTSTFRAESVRLPEELRMWAKEIIESMERKFYQTVHFS